MAPFLSSSKELMVSFVPQSGQVSGKPSRPSRLKHLIGRTAFGAALLTACLQAGDASALSFNFSFSGDGNPTSPATVTGTVDGLVDNLNDQKTGLTVTVTSATNSGSLSLPSIFTDANYNVGNGFNVSGGQVTGANIRYLKGSENFSLNNTDVGTIITNYSEGMNFFNRTFDRSPMNSLSFIPVAPDPVTSVPGPLPLFGAGAAFGWSRRLRRRIKSPA